MEVLKLHCPSCGAILDVPDDIDTFYCSHCGTKLLISGQDKNTLDAKVRLRVAEKKLDLEYADKQRKREHQLKQERQTIVTLLIITVVVFIGLAIMFSLMNKGYFSWSWMIRKTLGF